MKIIKSKLIEISGYTAEDRFLRNWKVKSLKDLNTKYSKEFKKILKENNGGKYLGYLVEPRFVYVTLIGSKKRLVLKYWQNKISIFSDIKFFKAE